MIGTEFLFGQGLGNQLFCYVTARCVALDRRYEFCTAGRVHFGDRRYDDRGLYFMDLDLGRECSREDFARVYTEKSKRVYLKTCAHDRKHGCDISLYDPGLAAVPDGTLLYGNMQSERYFIHHREEIKKWLKVEPEYDSYEFSRDDLCVINMRGSEYAGLKELFLTRKYWLRGMVNMRKINPAMRFMVVTEDVATARKVLPEVPAYHFDVAKDYVTIKNARYLLLSNSSFAFFPAFTSDTVRTIIAPKYWARHNVSDGYWSTGQNIYTGWTYQDRSGRLFTSAECLAEFEDYQRRTGIYQKETYPIEESQLGQMAGRAKGVLNAMFRRKEP